MAEDRQRLREQWLDLRDEIAAQEKFLIPVYSAEKAFREEIAETYDRNTRGIHGSGNVECQANGKRKSRLKLLRSVAEHVRKEIERIDRNGSRK